MAETLLQYLVWAIPSGGIGAAIAWIANRKHRETSEAKAVHDTYKDMYHDISDELRKLREENAEINKKFDQVSAESRSLKRSLDRLCRAIEAIQLCPYRAKCPVRAELQDSEHVSSLLDDLGDEGRGRRVAGQRKRDERKKTDGGDGSPIRGDPADSR